MSDVEVLTVARTHLWRIVLSLCIVGVLLIAVPQGYAQLGKATINGVVTDQSGALIPGAKVTITNTQTGTSVQTTTSSDGGYVVPFLPYGQYTITVEKTGFKTETHSNVTLTTDQVLSVPIALSVGLVSQTVEVTAKAQMLNTSNGTLGQIVNGTSVEALPLNGRNTQDLVYYAPGAISYSQTNSMPGQNQPGETDVSVNGARGDGSSGYLLDGANNSNTVHYSGAIAPNPDAVQEFRVITNNYDAQYGFGSDVIVSVVTRSGTNNWHGDVFDFLRNDALDATDFFSHVRDTTKYNQVGGSIGGPIIKDKLFIFGNYQGTPQVSTSSSGYTFTPTAAMMNGDFSYFLTAAGGSQQLHTPTGAIISGDLVDPTTFDPVSVNLVKAGIPLSTNDNGLYRLVGQTTSQFDQQFTIRGDYYATSKNRISVTVFAGHLTSPITWVPGNLLLDGNGGLTKRDNEVLSWVSTIRPTLTNQFTLGHNGNFGESTLYSGSGAVTLSSIGQKVNYPKGSLVDELSGPFGWSRNWGMSNQSNWNPSDTIAWQKGRQMIVAGVNIMQMYNYENPQWLSDPLQYFNGSITGNNFADYLLGYENQFEQGGGEANAISGREYNMFAQDSIRVKKNLTVNVGVRWEPFWGPTAGANRMAVFWPGHQSTRWPNAPEDLVFPGDAGVPTASFAANVNAVSPRLSIAWEPQFMPHTVIRTAFGIFRPPYGSEFYNHDGSNAPFAPTYQLYPQNVVGGIVHFADPWGGYAPTNFSSPFPPFAAATYVPPSTATFTLPVSVPQAFPINFKLPVVQSWNFTIEHEFTTNTLLRIAYIGSEGYHHEWPVDQNPTIYPTGLRAYSNFGQTYVTESDDNQSYNSLQVSVEKRFSHGFQLTSNYTWSHDLDYGSIGDVSHTGGAPDPFDLRENYGNADMDVRNLFATTGVWRSPGLKAYGKAVSSVLGGWQLAGIWGMHSGRGMSISGGEGGNNSGAGEYEDVADVTGQPKGIHQGPKSAWVAQYFNKAAWTFNAPGTFGDSGRNTLHGPYFNNVDLGLSKHFPFRERWDVEFRSEWFNAFNRAWLGTPDTNPSDSTFGVINGTDGGYSPRIIQFALKIKF